jgi:hypothetical protein
LLEGGHQIALIEGLFEQTQGRADEIKIKIVCASLDDSVDVVEILGAPGEDLSPRWTVTSISAVSRRTP